MSAVSSLLSSALSSKAQKSAANTAAEAQVQAAQISTDAMLEMWSKAQEDFRPYLYGGYQGMTQLTQQMPQYMQSVIAPLYQDYMGYNLSPLPDASAYTVNPVTGQVEQPRQVPQNALVDGDYMRQMAAQQNNYTAQSNANAGQQAQNALANVSRQPGQGGGFFSGGTQLAAASYDPSTTKLGTQAGVAGAWERQPMTRGNVPTPTNAMSSQNAMSVPTQQYTVPGAPTQRGMMIGGKWYNEEDITPEILGGDQWIANPALQPDAGPGQWIKKPIMTPGENTRPISTGQYTQTWQPDPSLPQQILNPNYTEKNIVERTDPNYQVDLPQLQGDFAPNRMQAQNALSMQMPRTAIPTEQQLEQGGVLAPTVPEFQRELNYQFNTEDPTYQIKLREKNEEIDKFLAKQGLQGSSAGESFRQREMDKFRAEEDATQYGRALTERNYLTQTDVDKYNLLANRGNTLYGRMQNQQDTLYNRQLGNAMTTDERNLNLLGQRYNLGSGVYGQLYGNALDLAKMGAGAAGSAGQSSITTGQNIGQNALYAGNAQAQNALTAGMANAAMWQSIGQAPANAWSAWQYAQPQNYGTGGTNYYGGGNGMSYFNMGSGPTYSYNAANTISGPYGR